MIRASAFLRGKGREYIFYGILNASAVVNEDYILRRLYVDVFLKMTFYRNAVLNHVIIFSDFLELFHIIFNDCKMIIFIISVRN